MAILNIAQFLLHQHLIVNRCLGNKGRPKRASGDSESPSIEEDQETCHAVYDCDVGPLLVNETCHERVNNDDDLELRSVR